MNRDDSPCGDPLVQSGIDRAWAIYVAAYLAARTAGDGAAVARDEAVVACQHFATMVRDFLAAESIL